MSIEDIFPSLFAILLVWLVVRYVTRGKQSGSGIPGVTRQMVDTVHAAFPDIPLANVVYSLSRTRSAQATSEEILERGFLLNPPANFTIPNSLLPAAPTPQPNSNPSSSPSSTGGTCSKPNTITSLVDRFGLRDRVFAHSDHSVPAVTTNGINGVNEETRASEQVKAWESTKEAREIELRKRKERMILEARKRMLEKQKQQEKQEQTERPAEVAQ